MGAIKAVFRSWDNPRANVYRRDNDIPYSWGTAVNVQSMAFGNMGDDCGTGVAFTRDPATGEKKLFGEFLTNAQGEDVVAGVRTPMPIAEMAEKFPEAYDAVRQRSATSWRITTATCRTWSSPSRTASSTCCRPATASAPLAAALKIACDLVDEGMIAEKQAVAMIDPQQPGYPAASPVRRQGPEGRRRPCGKGSGRLPRRCLRQDRLHRRGRQGLGRTRRKGGSGPSGDLSRGHRGHEGRPGHPDRPRRYDLSRGRCGPRHGQLLRLRLRRHQHGRGKQAVRLWPARPITRATGISMDGSTGNIYDGAIPTVDASHRRRLRPHHGLGRQVPPPAGPHQRRHPPRRRQGP